MAPNTITDFDKASVFLSRTPYSPELIAEALEDTKALVRKDVAVALKDNSQVIASLATVRTANNIEAGVFNSLYPKYMNDNHEDITFQGGGKNWHVEFSDNSIRLRSGNDVRAYDARNQNLNATLIESGKQSAINLADETHASERQLFSELMNFLYGRYQEVSQAQNRIISSVGSKNNIVSALTRKTMEERERLSIQIDNSKINVSYNSSYGFNVEVNGSEYRNYMFKFVDGKMNVYISVKPSYSSIIALIDSETGFGRNVAGWERGRYQDADTIDVLTELKKLEEILESLPNDVNQYKAV